jgi:hypothetical protein
MNEDDRQRFEDLRFGYERELKRAEGYAAFWKGVAYLLAAALFLVWLFHTFKPVPGGDGSLQP